MTTSHVLTAALPVAIPPDPSAAQDRLIGQTDDVQTRSLRQTDEAQS